ncbi:MAG: hypothetical protein ABFS45_05085 [Pseudomonadota bacterium]
MKQFDELKQLLIGEERHHLSRLEERLDDPHRRAEDLAEILPDSISISKSKGPGLAQCLQEPVTECVKHAAREHTQLFADALFPVIMPAVRRSIAEALRAFVQTLNQTLEQALSPKNLSWRLEALRSGIPYHEMVLKHTLIYRVEQVFLIHRKTGLLVSHLSHPDIEVKDSDAVSAMFTAIQDFVHETFDSQSSDEIDSIDIGDHTTWLIYGPYVTLACVIRGIPPLELRQQLASVVEELNRRFGSSLEIFDGDKNAIDDVNPVMQRCLSLEANKDSTRRSTLLRSAAVLLGLVLLILILISTSYWAVNTYQDNRRFDSLLEALENRPGMLIFESSDLGEQMIYKGLRDPLAVEPMVLAGELGFDEREVAFAMTPYYSAEAPIVLQRARRALEVPGTVRLTLSEGVLKAMGTAPYRWLDRNRNHTSFIPGIERIDLNGVSADDESLRREILALLDPPEGVEIGIESMSVRIIGRAPWPWILSLPDKLDRIEWLVHVNVDQLSGMESARLLDLYQRINNKNIYFLEGIRIREDSRTELQGLVSNLRLLKKLTEQNGARLKIRLTGYTDGTGYPEFNRRLRTQRASEILRLFSFNLDPNMFTIDEDQETPNTGSNASKRRVKLTLDIVKPDIQSLFVKWRY